MKTNIDSTLVSHRAQVVTVSEIELSGIHRNNSNGPKCGGGGCVLSIIRFSQRHTNWKKERSLIK